MRAAGVLVVGVLVGCIVSGAEATVKFDSNNCTAEVPCCVKSDDVQKVLGTITKSFCKIEYHVRTETNWNNSYARKLDRLAEEKHDELKERGCDHEPCKGFICAEVFPRCFYVDETTQGAFVFETCKKTCEDCHSTCDRDESPLCGDKPSQLELACTSSANGSDLSKIILAAFTFFCLWFAVY
mmetsp:Transcript_33356/g.51877  ORF Transcript_33356/g.51877 Transcript_33356/m.51877 type:complete len:183 (-) Transcript_33356:122-670(-)|eukprot:CAMPEP_0184311460 /NCGR_PEP_ID=MMETSP1049-20130417/41915_1 /TAXON_ID=77928 /ORGANISM="Proteomonas sulcata, Strain CCMP704" /LENGTH=182 /DNA_ID=CAMNT_0026626847 /DNA_START=97 /DNA_END=645 /DNA_ORIENTATION=+